MTVSIGSYNVPNRYVPVGLNAADSLLQKKYLVYLYKQIKNYLGLNSIVIYNPIKPVNYLPNIEKDIFYIFVGRARSPNKRVKEIIFPL